MDRLSRNLDDLRAVVQKLSLKRVRIEVLKENLVFTGENSPLANLMLSVMGAFAEFEREGIALAKKEASTGGTKKHSPPSRRQN